jgi:hypothetical protein
VGDREGEGGRRFGGFEVHGMRGRRGGELRGRLRIHFEARSVLCENFFTRNGRADRRTLEDRGREGLRQDVYKVGVHLWKKSGGGTTSVDDGWIWICQQHFAIRKHGLVLFLQNRLLGCGL